MESCAEERACLKAEARFVEMMAKGSASLAYQMNLQRCLIWPCGHPRNAANTQWFRGEPRCRTCRKKRWLKSFNLLVERRANMAAYDARLKAERAEAIARRAAERDAIFDMAREEEKAFARLSFETLTDGICAAFDLDESELTGKCREHVYIHARAVLYRILRDRGHSLPTIGRLTGGRDHSTILNSLGKFDWYARIDPRVAETYELLKDRVNAS